MSQFKKFACIAAISLIVFSCNKKDKEIQLPVDPNQQRIHDAAVEIQKYHNWHFYYHYGYTPPDGYGGLDISKNVDTSFAFTMPSDSFVKIWCYENRSEKLLPLVRIDDTSIYYANVPGIGNPRQSILYNFKTNVISYYEYSYHVTSKYIVSIESY